MTKTMGNSLMLGIALSAVVPSAAIAQDDLEVVVMRRVIALPNRTSSPASKYKRVGTIAQVQPLTGGAPTSLSFDTTRTGVMCRDESTGKMTPGTTCEGSPSAVGHGIFYLPVTSSAELRTVVFSPSDLAQKVPTLADATSAQLCNSTISVDGATWRLSCNAVDVAFHYAKRATKVYMQTLLLPYASLNKPTYSGNVAMTAAGVECIDTTTNAPAAVASRCDYLPNPDGVGSITVKGTYGPSFRTVVVDKDEILRIVPAATNVDQTICQAGVGAVVTGGGSEQWFVRCDPSSITKPYIKVVTSLSAQAKSATKSTASGAPDFTEALTLLPGVICRDTATGQVASDSSRCATIATPNPVIVQAAFSPQLRALAVPLDELVAMYPEIATSNLCAGTLAVTSSAANATNWKLRCTPEDVRLHYAITPLDLAPNNWRASETITGPNIVVTNASFNGSTATACIDTDSTTPKTVAASLCDNVARPANASNNIEVPGTYSPTYKRLYVAPEALEAIAPNVTRATLCSGSFIGPRLDSWQLTCNAEDVRVHHRKEIATATIVYANTATLTSGPLRLVAAQMQCRDTDEGKGLVATGFCQYIPDPAAPTTNIAVTASSASARVLSVSRAAVEALIPTMNMTTFCKSTTIDNQKLEYWNVTCTP